MVLEKGFCVAPPIAGSEVAAVLPKGTDGWSKAAGAFVGTVAVVKGGPALELTAVPPIAGVGGAGLLPDGDG